VCKDCSPYWMLSAALVTPPDRLHRPRFYGGMALGSSVTRPKIELIPHPRLLGSRDEKLAAGRDGLFEAHFRFANSLYDGGVDRYWT
jgi:hypothetical protein